MCGSGQHNPLCHKLHWPDPDLPQDLLVVAELSGPRITTPKTIASRPGEQLVIPPLPMEGIYVLDNIRLMSGDQVVLHANPAMALTDTICRLLITQVVSRPLKFATESGTVRMEIPVVMDNKKAAANI